MSHISKTTEFCTLSESIQEQLQMVLGSIEQVREDCLRISELMASPPSPREMEDLYELAEILHRHDDPTAQPICTLLVSVIRNQARPWRLLKRLLEAVGPATAGEATDLALDLVEDGRLPLHKAVLNAFSRLMALEFGPFDDEDALARLGAVIDSRLPANAAKSGGGLVHLLCRGADDEHRRMAARLLDMNEAQAPSDVALRVLGPVAYRFFRPYLEFTLATHTDVFLLSGGKRLPRSLVEMFRVAERDFGRIPVREAIAALGWERVSLGLKVQPYVEMSTPGILPIFVQPPEVELFDGEAVSPVGKCLLVTAHGGQAGAVRKERDPSDPIDRFRIMNIAHAELLGEILDVVPLDRDKVLNIVAVLEDIVATFHFLFQDVFSECEILLQVWGKMRDRVLDEVGTQANTDRPSPVLTRLVLAFEDPANLGEVRTMHGLKRYLHQKGLKLGFDLVGADHSPNRTVDLLLIRDDAVVAQAGPIRYAEFETGCEADPDPWIPFPVRMAVDGLAWQLLHGTQTFPGVDVFMFGNEVHYYISFRNHPVFLRIDYSPPQRGGMFDLEYFGVSNYELDLHPNIQLDAISAFFRRLEFDVQVQGTRLFVRYDKERSNNLGDLLARAAILFRLVPFLMDVDWVIGSLQLPAAVRRVVERYWAERFSRSGVLPTGRILNAKRTAILVDRTAGPTGIQETFWDGKGPYADRCSQAVPEGLLTGLRRTLEGLGLRTNNWSPEAETGPVPLLELERNILAPLRSALACGQVRQQEGRLGRTPSDLFQLEHEADCFADLLTEGGPLVREAIALSRPLAELDPHVEFETSGFIGELTVERAKVVVRGGELAVYVVRDLHGVIRLGMYAREGILFRRRSRPGDPWRSNACLDSARFWSLLHGSNYVSAVAASVPVDMDRDLAELQVGAALGCPVRDRRYGGRERVLGGVKAAPGRVVGHAVFGTEGRQPAELEGAILVAREVRPSDNPFLFRSAGVISTGGAVLSHAALLAIQFGKPAILAAGRWTSVGHKSALNFSVAVHREREHLQGNYAVRVLEVVEERTEALVEGDLVVLDANEGMAEILGQGRDIAILWENFTLLGEAGGRSRLGTGDDELMEIRAQQLRARHQIEKALGRISDPTTASFAVQELVVGRTLAGIKKADRTRLLSILMANEAVAATAAEVLATISKRLLEECRAAERACLERISSSRFLYEVIGLRLRALRRCEALNQARDLLRGCGLSGIPTGMVKSYTPDFSAILRLTELVNKLMADLDNAGPRTRHLLRRIQRIDRVLGGLPSVADLVWKQTLELATTDTRVVAEAGCAQVLSASACGLETHPHIGWKAANLAEMGRLTGAQVAPPWFVVTARAFQEMLSSPMDMDLLPAECPCCPDASLGQAIDAILQTENLANSRKAACIRTLWIAAELPSELRDQVREACREVQGPGGDGAYLAVRSSSCDEDSETEMRAGEFETYLFVCGADSVLDHLKLAWSGFWTERALYSRQSSGKPSRQPTGGVIVQRMVRSRVSGVLQTVNVGRDDLNELLINVGLGLGEGIVSGKVAADLVTVVKDIAPGEDPVHFNYLTNDKPEQVTFDDKRGSGTHLEVTLYHQRLRPAIEYTELCEITRLAMVLEDAYGYPLDIEFALEGSRLWLLQARPIATFSTELRETLEHHPLREGPRSRTKAGVS